MPGNVLNAAPASVLPQMLCTAFQQTREIALQANDFRNGESQGSGFPIRRSMAG